MHIMVIFYEFYYNPKCDPRVVVETFQLNSSDKSWIMLDQEHLKISLIGTMIVSHSMLFSGKINLQHMGSTYTYWNITEAWQKTDAYI